MAYCSNCGEWVDAEDKFCNICGADVKDAGRGQGGDPARAGGRGQPGRDPQHGQPAGGMAHGQPAGGTAHGQPAGGQHPPGGAAGEELPQDSQSGIDFAFDYPKRDGWKPAILSGLLLFGSFLILPGLILVGYGYRVSRAAALGQPFPPKYEDWEGLLVDGLRFLAVLTVIGIVVLVLVTVLGAAAGQAPEGSAGVFAVILLLLYLLLLYVVPAYLTAFVGSDDVVGAFTDGRAIDLVTSGYYFKAMLFAILLRIVLNILMYFSAITIVGPIFVGGFMVPAFGAFWGYVYYQAAERGIVPPPAEDEPPVAEPAPHGTRQPSR